MTDLNASQTLEHLTQSYTREVQANMRYHFAARLADTLRRPDIAQVLRAAADDVQGRTSAACAGRAGAAEEKGHALGFLDMLIEHGAQVPELVSESLSENLKHSIEAELHEFSTLYTRYAEVAAQEGFPEIARWYLALAEAGRTHARWLQQCLDGLEAKP